MAASSAIRAGYAASRTVAANRRKREDEHTTDDTPPMVIGKTDEEEDDEASASWERAATQRVIMDEHGPEPEVIQLTTLKATSSSSDEDEDVYVKASRTRSESRHRAALIKATVALLACFFYLLIYLTSFFAMDPGGLGSVNGNIKTSVKIGRILGMQDTAVSPCTNVYERACGSYDKEFQRSSLFQETQLSILADLKETLPRSWGTLEATLGNVSLGLSDADLAALGVVGCVDVDIDADYMDRSVSAIYLSPPCWSGCAPTRHPHGPVVVTTLMPGAPDALTNLVATAQGSGAKVYWLPLNSSYPTVDTFQCWHNASTMWAHRIARLDTFDLANTYYSVDAPRRSPDISRLVAGVKKVLGDMMQVTDILATSTTKIAFMNRVYHLPVLHGSGPNALEPRCIVGTPLVDCLMSRFQSAFAATTSGSTVRPGTLWSSSALEVNAYYSPTVDAVYIPGGIMQWPYYSPDWPEWMQMATLGAVIAHEIGHAIMPGWAFAPHLAPEDIARITGFQNCLIRDVEVSGVSEQRAILTLSENWADAISARMVLKYSRGQSAQTTRDSLMLWSQTWCAAGTPHYAPLSTDPHSTPYLRVNGTILSLPNFYYVYGCALDMHRVCGL